MRKFYILIAGLIFCLITFIATGQENSFSSVNKNTSNTFGILIQDALNLSDKGITGIEETPITCQADFEINQTPNYPLYKKFTAIAGNSEQKKPVYICWKFGDGKDTCIQYSNAYAGPYPVVHLYHQPGNYEVCVSIVYDGGCEAKNCKIVVVEIPEECKADFEKIPVTSSTNPLAVYYKALPWNSNNKKPKQICWNFGDGKDTCIAYPENFTGTYAVRHEYHLPGNYEVCIKLIYFGGCEAKNCKAIQIAKPDECKADFERIPTTSITANPLVAYYKALPVHNNNKKPKQIVWKFGDGKDTSIIYPENYTGTYYCRHEYHDAGTYEVCVKIIYYGGCEAYSCKKNIISRPDECKADFERIPENVANHPLLAYYKALTAHNNNKKPKQICWKFGDGKDTCIIYPENYTGIYVGRHEYREGGTYEVCVKIIYYGGCEAYSCKKIIVEKPDECKADFVRITENVVSHPLLAYYKALTAHNNNKKPKQIVWKFGDGKDTSIIYPENYTGIYIGRHEYPDAGNYEVCVKIIYYGGCEANSCKKIIISKPDECKVDFERIPTTSNYPLLIYYKALLWHNNNKKPKQICWKFGDGKDTCITYPENYTGLYVGRHEYKDKGNYEVCISILYYGGCESKNCKFIQVVSPDDCKAGFERLPVSSTANPMVAYFNALTAHNNNKKPKQICWKFGDGKDTCITYPENFAGNYVVRHEYRDSHDYEVCVIIQYYGGCEAKNCGFVKIEGRSGCIVKISELLTPIIPGLEKGFTASYYTSNNKRPLRICWNFGDGKDTCIELSTSATLNQLSIRHNYHTPGVYKTCVRIVFDGGCVAENCVEAVARPISNNCGGYMTNTLISPRIIKFKAFAVNNPGDPVISYHWTFGDGSSAEGMEVTHSYKEQNTYEVCLFIKTQSGCETRICKKVIVQDNNKPALQISPNPVVNTMHLVFYSTHTETVNIKIVNAFGVIVRSYTRNAVVGSNNWDLDLATLGTGTYMIYIQSPNQLTSLLFIKN